MPIFNVSAVDYLERSIIIFIWLHCCSFRCESILSPFLNFQIETLCSSEGRKYLIFKHVILLKSMIIFFLFYVKVNEVCWSIENFLHIIKKIFINLLVNKISKLKMFIHNMDVYINII